MVGCRQSRGGWEMSIIVESFIHVQLPAWPARPLEPEKDAKALMEKCVPLEIPPKYRSLPVLTGILHYCSCISSDAVSLTVLYLVCCRAGLSLVNVVPEQFVWICVFELTRTESRALLLDIGTFVWLRKCVFESSWPLSLFIVVAWHRSVSQRHSHWHDEQQKLGWKMKLVWAVNKSDCQGINENLRCWLVCVFFVFFKKYFKKKFTHKLITKHYIKALPIKFNQKSSVNLFSLLWNFNPDFHVRLCSLLDLFRIVWVSSFMFPHFHIF